MSQDKSITIAFSAGETSGDQHAAQMFLQMQSQYPGIKGIGMGGTAMRQAGINLWYNSERMGVIGLVEVFKHLFDIFNAMRTMRRLLTTEKVDLLVCVDYKEFNYWLARFAKKNGIKVLFYVSPQVWAWRASRVRQFGKVIDMMAVIFPFEVPFYQAENVPVRYVGHPSVEKTKAQLSRFDAFNFFGLGNSKPVVGIFPGSRTNEIERMLPVMLEAARRLQSDFPDIHFLLAQADTISDALLENYLRPARLMITVIKKKPYDVMQCCDAIMTTSGTASLEIALMGVPLVISYKLSKLTYWLGRLLVKIPYIGLPNIILGRPAVKEFIQNEANAENLAREISKIINDDLYAEKMRQDLIEVKKSLGSGGGSSATAELALELVGAKKADDLTHFFANLDF
jgi:lipid-A-disaccharide synthase